MPISYEDVEVSQELVDRLRKELDDAPPNYGKFVKFKGVLHYGNMRRWQQQGWHYNHAVGDDEEYCVCGLVLTGRPKPAEYVDAELDIDLSDLQRVRGHRRLPDFDGITVALIVDHDWSSAEGEYLWTAYCQECLKVLDYSLPDVAHLFVQEHNERCGHASSL